MFGYIDLNPKTLTEEQEGRYKAWYCGLCRTIRDAYGQIGRVALSNDMTFLTVLLSSLYEPEEKGGEAACPVHPLHRRAFVTSQLTRYAADMNMLLAYWKAKDSERDGEGGVHRHMLGRLQTIYGELSAAYPEQCRGVQTATEAIWDMETKGERQIDRLCALSGDMLGAVFVAKDDIFAPVLREIGRGLGAFISLMDAYEDEEEDAKKGRFNPLGDLPVDETAHGVKVHALLIQGSDEGGGGAGENGMLSHDSSLLLLTGN